MAQQNSVAVSIVADIPGRARSTHFAAAVSSAGAWQEAFVLESTAKDSSSGSPINQGYYSHLNGFTNSWASVMLAAANTEGVRLRVTRLGGAAIKTAAEADGDRGAASGERGDEGAGV